MVAPAVQQKSVEAPQKLQQPVLLLVTAVERKRVVPPESPQPVVKRKARALPFPFPFLSQPAVLLPVRQAGALTSPTPLADRATWFRNLQRTAAHSLPWRLRLEAARNKRL